MRFPKHSTIVAYLALFIALGGTSYAAVALKANSVGSTQIRDRSVRVADLAPGARPSNMLVPFPVPGAKGEPGAAGAAGIGGLGSPGASGAPGASGLPGADGARGLAGADGATGAKGLDGASGPKGDVGPAGPPGDNRAFGVIRHVASPQSDQAYTANIQGATVTHPGLGFWCLTPGSPGLTAISVTPDTYNTQPFVMQPDDPRTSCPAGRFSIVMMNNNGQDVGWSFIGS